MNENFKKLKKQCLVAAIIKSVVAGLSAGLIVTGVFLLSFGLAEISIHWALYVLIGFVVAAACGGGCFLYLRPTDKKIAKRYDEEYALGEKLQTMVAYAGEEGDIIAIQREDAAEKLHGVSAGNFKISRIWYLIVAAVLALAMLFTGIFVPGAAQSSDDPPVLPVEPVEPDPDEFEYDLFMQSAMAELILNVRECSLEKTIKDEFVTVLEGLDAQLKETASNSQKDASVIYAVTRMDALINSVNTFRAVSSAFDKSQKEIADGLRESVAVYNLSTVALNEYDRVKSFKARIGGLIETVLEVNLEASRNSLNVGQKEEPGLKEAAAQFNASILFAIEASQVGKEDAIYKAFGALVDSVNAMAGKINRGYTDAALQADIDNAYAKLKSDLCEVLGEQCYNCVMNIFVRQKLSKIFGVDYKNLPEFNKDLGGNKTGDGEDEPDKPQKECDCEDHSECKDKGCDCGCLSSSSAGYGEGEEIFGSNDEIYDPDYIYIDEDGKVQQGAYVKYGVVLDRYYEKVLNRLFEGATSDEVREIIEDYFKVLYGGTGENSSDGN